MVLYVLAHSSFFIFAPCAYVHGFAFSPYRHTIRGENADWSLFSGRTLAVVKINKIIKHSSTNTPTLTPSQHNKQRGKTDYMAAPGAASTLRGWVCICVCGSRGKMMQTQPILFSDKRDVRLSVFCVCAMCLSFTFAHPYRAQLRIQFANLANDVFCNSMILRAQILIRLR